MTRNLAIFAAVAAVTCTGAALADDVPGGWYAGVKGGVDQLEQSKSAGTASPLNTKGKFERGPVLKLDGGYDFGNVRLEGEFGYQSNDLHRVAIRNISGLGPVNYNGQILGGYGSLENYSLMGNIYYDFHNSTALTPYVGIGIGGARLSYDDASIGARPFANSNDIVFAYQGIAGVSYAVTPQLSTSLEYRYMSTADASLKAVNGEPFRALYQSHALLFGLTWKFGAPEPKMAEAPPPPPPAPAPAPAPAPEPPKQSKPYLVFFDFDKAKVTPEGRKIIEQAAADFKQNGKATIVLTGHTDTVGSAEYNMKLSLRRARAVQAALAKLGISKKATDVIGKGKTEPLVQTGDGVREPQNRRVEIVLK